MFKYSLTQNFFKIYSKTHQAAPCNKVFSWEHATNPLSMRVTLPQAASRHATHLNSRKMTPPWQTLHTPMLYC